MTDDDLRSRGDRLARWVLAIALGIAGGALVCKLTYEPFRHIKRGPFQNDHGGEGLWIWTTIFSGLVCFVTAHVCMARIEKRRWMRARGFDCAVIARARVVRRR